MKRLLFAFLLLAPPAWATTRYISPSGSDANSCAASATITTPKKTFTSALACMAAGDTLILRDGTYSIAAGTGLPNINCSSGSPNGTALNKVTIQAENERQAFISGDGSTYPFQMHNCSYWNIEGLRIKGTDNASGPSGGNAVWLELCHFLTVQRNLITHNNRYRNGSIVYLNNTDYSLIEENEIYYWHRNGMNASNHNTFRRNYMHSRGHADLPDGFTSALQDSQRGDSGVVAYPGSYNLYENNIVEDVYNAFDIEALGASIGNRYLGCIAIASRYGFGFAARGNTLDNMPRDSYIENGLVLNALNHGVNLRANKNTRVYNVTVTGSGHRGFSADSPSLTYGDGVHTLFGYNILSFSNVEHGFNISHQEDWDLDYPNSYGNGTAFVPAASDANITHELTTNPSLGGCYAWIPAASPMKGAGLAGADIGANILYQIVDGVTTSTPLWNPSTGNFTGCGVVVAGVNDVAGSSCLDVDARLNINTGGCSFPDGYGGTDPNYYTLIYPNGGQTWTTTTNQTITWSSGGTPGPGAVKIELFRNSAYETLSASTTDDGSYQWTVAGAAATDAKIKLSDVDTGTIIDESDAAFTITAASEPGTITVSGPETGGIYFIGAQLPIAITTVDVSGNVKAELSLDGGVNYKVIVGSVAYNSSIGWTVRGSTSSNCKVKVTSLDNPAVYGVSGTFRIGGSKLLIPQ